MKITAKSRCMKYFMDNHKLPKDQILKNSKSDLSDINNSLVKTYFNIFIRDNGETLGIMVDKKPRKMRISPIKDAVKEIMDNNPLLSHKELLDMVCNTIGITKNSANTQVSEYRKRRDNIRRSINKLEELGEIGLNCKKV